MVSQMGWSGKGLGSHEQGDVTLVSERMLKQSKKNDRDKTGLGYVKGHSRHAKSPAWSCSDMSRWVNGGTRAEQPCTNDNIQCHERPATQISSHQDQPMSTGVSPQLLQEFHALLHMMQNDPDFSQPAIPKENAMQSRHDNQQKRRTIKAYPEHGLSADRHVPDWLLNNPDFDMPSSDEEQ